MENNMQIDNKLITYLEDLSCLTLSEGEKSRLTGDLQEILGYMAKLGELNTEGVSERSHPFDNVNVFRDDEAFPSQDRALILKNAAAKNDEMFIAPKTVE
jgi:aspartyl/glutamyl-tRNA(Asn/Gln) amidotransferase C subunit